MAAGRHGADAVAENLHPYLQVGQRQSAWAFETSKPTPGDTPPPARPNLLILPK